jgi:hypothetical protein
MTTPVPKFATPAARAAAKPREDSGLAGDLRAVMHHRLGHALAIACAGACVWFFAVRPVERAYATRIEERESLESKIASSKAKATGGPSAQEQAMQLRELLNDVKTWSEASRDQRGLYDALTRLAASANVRLERIEPTTGQSIVPIVNASTGTVQPRSRRGRNAAATTPAGWSGRTVGHRLAITGTYEQISDFIAACETDLGATKVLTFRISSEAVRADKPGVVEATLETIHLALTPPTPEARRDGAPTQQAEGGDR